MANLIIKSDERKAYEDSIRRDFTRHSSAEAKEYAECIAARTTETYKKFRKMEEKYR
ncbi:MAG: hypothetical protein Q4D26_10440 [Clostridia bacterium]|nr:hypothetical protein [Clostridia bacterium]MDO4301795.1 hypothetical protein [Clostridia bacterium]